MSFTVLTLVILAITATNIYFQIRRGYKHGMTRSLINIAVLIFCAFFAALLSILIGSVSGNIAIFIIDKLGYYEILSNTVGNLVLIIAIIAQMVVPLLLYIPLFFLSKTLTKFFLNAILNRFVKVNNPKKANYISEDEDLYVRKDKVIGAVLGVVSGFIITVVTLTPFVGILQSTDDVVYVVKEVTDIEQTEFGMSLEAVPKYANDMGVTVIDVCGAGVLYELTTTTTVAGYTTSINKEISAIRNIDFKSVMDKFSENTEFNTDTITELEPALKSMSKSLVLKVFAVEIVRGVSTKWINDDSYAGMKKPSLSEHKFIEDLFDNVLSVCATTTVHTFDADMTTLISLLNIIGEEDDVLNSENYDDLMSGIAEREILERIDYELSKNPHMASIRTAVKELLMSLVASQINAPSFTEAEKQDIYRELALVLNDSQGMSGATRVNAISGEIMQELESRGINVSESVVKQMTEILCDGISSTDGSITDKQVQNFIEAYLNNSDSE